MKNHWNHARIILPSLLLIWIILTTILGHYEPDLSIQAPQKGFLAPEITLPSLAGNMSSLSDYQGKIVILNLWASWCPPCVKEMEAIQQIYTDYQNEGLTVLAVNMTFQDSQTDAAEFVRENGLEFPVLFDLNGITAETYNMYALPTTFFIDRDGVVQDVIIGGAHV